jgi:hypothetical protein
MPPVRAPIERLFASHKSRTILHAAISAAFVLTELGDATVALFHRIFRGARTVSDVHQSLREPLLTTGDICERARWRVIGMCLRELNTLRTLDQKRVVGGVDHGLRRADSRPGMDRL